MKKTIFAVTLALTGCGDDANSTDTTGTPTGSSTSQETTGPIPMESSGSASSPDTTSGGTTMEDDTGATGTTTLEEEGTDSTGSEVDPIDRGDYLVNHVATCGVCHTPLDNDGLPDRTRFLAGNPTLFDLDPGDPAVGALPVPNITPHIGTGIGDWTANEIRAAFQDGLDNEGNALASVMPYYAFHNLTDDDADAIVAYLQSIAPIDNEIPDRQPLPFPVDDPVQPVPWDQVPQSTLRKGDPDYEAAQVGRYLAGAVGGCHECHTPHSAGPVPVDMSLSYGGGRALGPIMSTNLTPHPNGIEDYDVQDVVNVLLSGTEPDGDGICPPMPVGPMGAFSGMTIEDAEAIGVYLTTLEPIDNGTFPECTP